MPFPKTKKELVDEGYKFVFPRQCRGRTCKVTIYWYDTPAGKRIPLSAVASQPGGSSGLLLEPHFATCPDVKDFRKDK